jgi:hypothetical protein
VIIADSEKSVLALDEKNNLYVLEARFGGVQMDNIERVLRYSEKGGYLGEIYRLQYTNEDFILTKGKIARMACYGGLIYLLRLNGTAFGWNSGRLTEAEKQMRYFLTTPMRFVI